MKTIMDRIHDGSDKRICQVAKAESLDPLLLQARILQGSVILMTRGKITVGIGEGLKTKVNANIGTSPQEIFPENEVEKAIIAEKSGADTISDLSTGGDIRDIRKRIASVTDVPLTTVPIYQAVAESGMKNLDDSVLMDIIKEQAEEGISSFVIHATSNETFRQSKSNPRIMRIVSKGGSLAIAYMMRTGKENPYLARFDEILDIMKKHDIVLSLGNTMRSGCISDPWDPASQAEMKENYALAHRAFEAGVQVIVEGAGGHIRMDRIADTVISYKKNYPFPLFVAGPLPTDIAVGHDHIAAAVGASIASGAGADYLCYITPAEHLSLPDKDQVREGVIACKIAAHIGDTVKRKHSENLDRALATGRSEMDWESQRRHAIDPEGPVREAPQSGPCTMCGDYCAIEIIRKYLSP